MSHELLTSMQKSHFDGVIELEKKAQRNKQNY
jgi:hypothetical protein